MSNFGKYYFLLIVGILVFSFCTACNALEDDNSKTSLSRSQRVLEASEFEHKITGEYQLSRVNLGVLDLNEISGATSDRERMYIVDSQKPRICVYDSDGKMLEEIVNENFDELGRILVVDGCVYVVDKHQSMLYKYEKGTCGAYELPEKVRNTEVIDMVKVGEHIILSYYEPSREYAYASILNVVTSEVKKLPPIDGYLGSSSVEDEIYCMNTFEVVSGSSKAELKAGENFFSKFDISSEKSEIQFRLPSGFLPTDFLVNDDGEIIVYSASMSAVCRYDLAGNYKETLAIVPNSNIHNSIFQLGDSIYLALLDTSELYKLTKTDK